MKSTHLFVISLSSIAISACAPSKKDPYDTGNIYGNPDAAYADAGTDGTNSIYETPAAYDEGNFQPDLSPAEPPASSDSSYFRTHTVVSGDNLSRISSKYNVKMSAIIQANNIKNKNLLVVGQKLIIPSR